jgi:hypothetical protein
MTSLSDRISEDPEFFIENYCFLQDPIKGKIPFKLYPWQKKALFQMHWSKSYLVLKSRQIGYTKLMVAYIAWILFTQPKKKIMLYGYSYSSSKWLIDQIQLVLTKKEIFNSIHQLRGTESIYDFVKWGNISELPFFVSTSTTISMDNGSSVQVVKQLNDFRGMNKVDYLFIDEMFHNRDFSFEELKSVYSHKIIAGGTPSGKDQPEQSFLYSHFEKVDTFNWDVVPGRDAAWLKNEMAHGASIEQFVPVLEFAGLTSL